jgi:hypothetical protein
VIGPRLFRRPKGRKPGRQRILPLDERDAQLLAQHRRDRDPCAGHSEEPR